MSGTIKQPVCASELARPRKSQSAGVPRSGRSGVSRPLGLCLLGCVGIGLAGDLPVAARRRDCVHVARDQGGELPRVPATIRSGGPQQAVVIVHRLSRQNVDSARFRSPPSKLKSSRRTASRFPKPARGSWAGEGAHFEAKPPDTGVSFASHVRRKTGESVNRLQTTQPATSGPDGRVRKSIFACPPT
jgi:hypothetical protein